MSFQDLHAEVLAEFGAFSDAREYHENVVRDARLGAKAKRKLRKKFENEVISIRRAEKARKTPPNRCLADDCQRLIPRVVGKKGPHAKYCSARCRGRDFWRKKLSKTRLFSWTCLHCGARIWTKGNFPTKWCSNRCRIRERRRGARR